MVKTNICLKRYFKIFNIILGIFGGIILALAVFGHGAYHVAEEGDGMLPGIVFFYILGVVLIALSALGMYGSWKEKKWALILSCIGLTLLCIAAFVIAGRVAASQKEIKDAIPWHFAHMVPLDKADEGIQKLMEQLQNEWNCCGLNVGYTDWGENIADSCLCPEYYKNTSICVEAHNTTANFSEQVYSQPCVPLLTQFVIKVVDIFLGIFFGFAFFVLIGAVLAMALLWQMRRQRKATPIAFSVNRGEPEYRELSDPADSI